MRVLSTYKSASIPEYSYDIEVIHERIQNNK